MSHEDTPTYGRLELYVEPSDEIASTGWASRPVGRQNGPGVVIEGRIAAVGDRVRIHADCMAKFDRELVGKLAAIDGDTAYVLLDGDPPVSVRIASSGAASPLELLERIGPAEVESEPPDTGATVTACRATTGTRIVGELVGPNLVREQDGGALVHVREGSVGAVERFEPDEGLRLPRVGYGHALPIEGITLEGVPQPIGAADWVDERHRAWLAGEGGS